MSGASTNIVGTTTVRATAPAQRVNAGGIQGAIAHKGLVTVIDLRTAAVGILHTRRLGITCVKLAH